MKIGVISDTHGMIERTRLAVELFEREAVEAIVHCGDVGGLDVLQLFVGKPFWFIWGNTDHPDASWRRALEAWGMAWPASSPLRLELAGRRIAVAHGHERDFRSILHDPQADYLFYGHSHSRMLVRAAGCTIVNPGAIQRTPLATVAIVYLGTDEVRHVDLYGQPSAAD
jgi:uncharacterized protein